MQGPAKLQFFVSIYYQLALVTPGIFPSDAHSLKVILEIPNFRIYPLGLPVALHRLCKRTGEEFLGNLSKAS